ncbi:hypothetical protein HGA64_02815 [Candidatus Falkowbacteria bacterium]|nr:hypothetical protein [Candidatus Falkowbacteria bacterium]
MCTQRGNCGAEQPKNGMVHGGVGQKKVEDKGITDHSGPFTVFMSDDSSNFPGIKDYAEAKRVADRQHGSQVYDHGSNSVVYTSKSI